MFANLYGNAPSWEILLPEADFVEFLKAIPKELLHGKDGRAVYIDPGGAEVAELFISGGTSASVGPTAGPLPKLDALGLRADSAGRLYILDFFSRKDASGCSHGDRVLEVASEVLRALGVDVLIPQIVSVELDLYSNKALVRQAITEYARTFAPDAEARLLSGLPQLLGKASPKPDGYFTSLLYLQAVYSAAILKGRASVISSSFYAQPDAIGVLPYWLLPPESPLLVTAVPDYPGSIEKSAPVQPQRSLWQLRREYPFVLSGAIDGTGVPFGMISDSGTGVTVAHRGSGWGVSARCMTPTTLGTSFSTPAIAAILFAVHEVLKHKGTSVSYTQLRRRMTLTARTDEQLVGKYASGGIPRPELMLRGGTIAFLSDGTKVEVEAITGTLSYEIGNLTATASIGVGLTNVSGLAATDTAAFVYIDERGAWQKAIIKSLSVSLVVAGKTVSLQSLDDFRNYLKEVLVL